MFSIFRKKADEFFSPQEKELIVAAIKKAEISTSGEVRVFIESRCRFVDAIRRAAEIFYGLKMQETEQRNAVLLYVALKDKQVAVFGDEGIHQKVGSEFWETEIAKMLSLFNKENYAEGIAKVVTDIGEVLHYHFPYNKDTDRNELPDEIVFGK